MVLRPGPGPGGAEGAERGSESRLRAGWAWGDPAQRLREQAAVVETWPGPGRGRGSGEWISEQAPGRMGSAWLPASAPASLSPLQASVFPGVALASWLMASLPCPEDHKGLHGKPFRFLNESGDKADL